MNKPHVPAKFMQIQYEYQRNCYRQFVARNVVLQVTKVYTT